MQELNPIGMIFTRSAYTRVPFREAPLQNASFIWAAETLATSGKYLEARVKKSSFFRFLARYYSLAFSSGSTLAQFGFPLSGPCFLW